MSIAHAFRPSRWALGAVLLVVVAAPAAAAPRTPSRVESLLTRETVGFLHVRVADLWDSPGLAFYRKMLASLGADEARAFEGRFVPGPSQIDTVTIIMPSFQVQR